MHKASANDELSAHDQTPASGKMELRSLQSISRAKVVVGCVEVLARRMIHVNEDQVMLLLRRTGKLTGNGASLFILLVLFQFPLFLWSKLGLFLLFPFAFIFTSLITHICFSVIEKECSTAITPSDRVE